MHKDEVEGAAKQARGAVKDAEAEKSFLYDLLKNQEIAAVPSNFKTLELEKGKKLFHFFEIVLFSE